MPVLVGYSSGATLAYAALVQAPVNTFRGAISLGFCPDLELRRPFCKGHGLVSQPTRDGKGVLFAPAGELAAPWIALQGDVDKVCDPKQTADFVARVGARRAGDARRRSGTDSRARSTGRRRCSSGLAKLGASAPAPPALAADVSDLPLVELPAAGSSDRRLAVILSGDGGWASIDREVGGALAAARRGVVGLDRLQYFWTKRTPDESAAALARVLRHYLGAWHSETRAPDRLLARRRRAAVHGEPAARTTCARASRWWRCSGRRSRSSSSSTSPTGSAAAAPARALPIPPEVAKLRGLRLLCVYGRDERESLCRGLDPALGAADGAAGRPPLRRRLRRDRPAHPRRRRRLRSGNVAQGRRSRT